VCESQRCTSFKKIKSDRLIDPYSAHILRTTKILTCSNRRWVKSQVQGRKFGNFLQHETQQQEKKKKEKKNEKIISFARFFCNREK